MHKVKIPVTINAPIYKIIGNIIIAKMIPNAIEKDNVNASIFYIIKKRRMKDIR